jgi:Flp pilus assembly protein protease CpaA
VRDLLAAPWPLKLALFTAFVALAASVVTDLRERRIPNAVTIPALLVMLGLFGANGGWPLVSNALLGAAICALPLLFAAVPGWVGMGDVKLMAVSGFAAGWPSGLSVLVLVALAGGLQAALQIAWAKARGREPPSHVPYGCANAAGTIAAFLLDI